MTQMSLRFSYPHQLTSMSHWFLIRFRFSSKKADVDVWTIGRPSRKVERDQRIKNKDKFLRGMFFDLLKGAKKNDILTRSDDSHRCTREISVIEFCFMFFFFLNSPFHFLNVTAGRRESSRSSIVFHVSRTYVTRKTFLFFLLFPSHLIGITIPSSINIPQ